MSDFVRVPQDGAGKRITTKEFTDSDGTILQTQVVHIGDKFDPNNQQRVNPDGAAVTTFSTGSPSFNAFNRLLTSDDELLSAFKFYEGPKAVSTRIAEYTTGGGTVAYDTSNLSYRCRVPAGAGNSAKISSHRHFSYKPGASITTYFVVATNQASPTNVTMRAGLYNDNDGLFMEATDGVMYCVIRNSTTGLERRVAQADWNGDKMDGLGGETNRSGESIDPTKMNIFGVTYQYLSAGAVTFFHYVNGNPVVLHTFGNYGELTAPYMATTYLPHTFEVETTGTGQVGDTDLYTFCSTSLGEGYKDIIRTPLAFEGEATIVADSDVPLISFRPSQTYLGTDNRYRYLLQYISAYSSAEPVVLSLWASTVLDTSTFDGGSLGLEFDSAATSVLGGLSYGKLICAGGASEDLNIVLSGGDTSTDGLFRKNDITESDVWTITARRISDSGSTKVLVSGSFFEVQ